MTLKISKKYCLDDEESISTNLEFNEIETTIYSNPLLNEVSNVGDCKRNCTQKFSEVMKITFSSTNHYERFENVCK